MELSFAALGWLHRAAQSVGGDRFTETVHRSRFYLHKAALHATTPAEVTVIHGLTATLEDLMHADAEARRLLDEAVSGIAEACAEEVDRLLDTTEGAA